MTSRLGDQSSGKWEYDPCFVEFRPDLRGKRNRDRYTLTTQDGAPVICHGEIEKAIQSMARLMNTGNGRQRNACRHGRGFTADWSALFPEAAAANQPFEIVDD